MVRSTVDTMLGFDGLGPVPGLANDADLVLVAQDGAEPGPDLANHHRPLRNEA